MTTESFSSFIKKAQNYGMAEFLEIMGELAQESTKKGRLSRVTKELITLGIALHKQCNRCIQIHTTDARKLGAKKKDITQVQKIALFMKATPEKEELWEAWRDSWIEFSLSKGKLEHHERELIALAIGLVMRNEKQITLHAKEALKSHASPEEVFEVVPIALLMDGAPVLSQIPTVVKAVTEG
jgi:AhpD family alkylhydroperoxidase